MPRSSLLAGSLLLLVGLTAACVPALAAPDDTVLLSQAGGVQGSAASFSPSLSADGRYAAFVTDAGNLTSAWNDINPNQEAVERDQTTGAFILASRESGDPQFGATANSMDPTVSGDGHLIAFETLAGNLSTLDTTGSTMNAYVFDTTHTATALVDHSDGPPQLAASCPSLPAFCTIDPSISRDGNSVVFGSLATNLVPGSSQPASDTAIYVHTLAPDHTRFGSAAAGTPANGPADHAVVSADGTKVAFGAEAPNLTERSDDDARPEVYEHDLTTGDVVLVSQSSGAVGQVAGNAGQPAMSADGRYVAFQADAPSFAPGAPSTNQVYLRDTVNNTTVPVSVADGAGGAFANGGSATPDAVSDDGRLVVFTSQATNLIAGSPTGTHLYVRDMQAATTTLLDRASGPSGAIANADVNVSTTDRTVSMSADGRFVAFASPATNLDPAATNGQLQIYRRELEPPVVPVVPVVPVAPVGGGTGAGAGAGGGGAGAGGGGGAPANPNPTPKPKPRALTLGKPRLSPSHLRRGHRATLSFALSAPAAITVSFSRRHCTTVRRKRRCTTIAEGAIHRAERAGKVTIIFTDKLGRRHLALGTQTLSIAASAPGMTAPTPVHATIIISAH